MLAFKYRGKQRIKLKNKLFLAKKNDNVLDIKKINDLLSETVFTKSKKYISRYHSNNELRRIK